MDSKKAFILKSENDWKAVVSYVQNINPQLIFLKGNLGAGKTTFTKYYMEENGYNDLVSSPTFSIVNSYLLSDDRVVYHMDLYRLQSYEELVESGIEEMLFSRDLCIIEWPEILTGVDLDGPRVTIDITHQAEGRKVVVES